MRNRPTSRVLVVDPLNRLLLLYFDFVAGSGRRRRFWATPGGALEGEESFEQAARRELAEETGLHLDPGPVVGVNHAIYELPEGDTVNAEERFFLVRTGGESISLSGQSPLERRVIHRYHWWTAAELRASAEQIYPENAAELLESLSRSE